MGGIAFDVSAKGLVRTPGFLSVAMNLREEFIIDWWKLTAFLGNRSLWCLNTLISGGGY